MTSPQISILITATGHIMNTQNLAIKMNISNQNQEAVMPIKTKSFKIWQVHILTYNIQGVEVLDNAFQGYNACLFAYGQTGSGKSYSIVGYGENKGIIPRACEEIFRRIQLQEKKADNRIKHTVELSMIEIYNEKVQDLLVKASTRPKEGLAVREHPEKGVYVEDAKFVPVSSYLEIQN